MTYNDDIEKSGQKFYAHLSQSWQLYAEATMFGLENIFTLAPSFRAEKSRTRRHLTEFWHAEVESAWMHNHQIMQLEEAMIIYLISAVLSKLPSNFPYCVIPESTCKSLGDSNVLTIFPFQRT